MKKLKLFSLILVALISSFFLCTNVKAYFKADDARVNEFKLAPLIDLTLEYYYIDDVDARIEFKPAEHERVFRGTVYHIGEDVSTELDYSDVSYYVNGNLYTDSTYTILANSTIAQVYMLNRYDVIFNYSYIDEYDQEHELKPSVTRVLNKGRVITLGENLEDEDYSQVKYLINDEFYNGSTYTTQGPDTIGELYYLNRYNITYDLDGGTVDSPNPTVYTARTGTITLNNPHKDKYEFLGWTWTGQTEPVEDVSFESTDKENKSFTANFHLLDVPAKVEHWQMNVTGEGYTKVDELTVPKQPGSTWTPEVNEYEGFESPSAQTVTVDPDGNTVVVYYYKRLQYRLTIENSEFVQTETPSGLYYYGTEITLVADEQNDHGAPFLKWNTGELLRSLTFTMTRDITLAPYYGVPYIISFETNGGTPLPLPYERYQGETLGELPTVINNDCELSEGSYDERHCTYAYEFKGWYKEETFEHPVDENFVPTEDMTLYAKWNKVYFHDDEEVFDGTNFLDTGVQLFSKENANMNFIARFTLDTNNSQNVQQATLFADINEKADPWPGTIIRYDKNHFELVANVTSGSGMGKRQKQTINGYGVGQTFVMKRENGKFYYSVDGGDTFTLFNDFSAFNRYFDINSTFGAEYDANGNPYRYFKGKLVDMTVELSERDSYTVKFDANGGTGTMLNQRIVLDSPTPLSMNAFTKVGGVFSHWTTNADGTGTRYEDGETVTGLAGKDEVVTLYAQWDEPMRYTVVFDANGGNGEMDDLVFEEDEQKRLTLATFTKEGQAFNNWNTEPDGSGTSYRDQALVGSLSSVDGDVVTLYAQYGNLSYHYDGIVEFDGTNYLDTKVNIYCRTNLDRDFKIEFDILSVDPANATSNEEQPTILNTKDEDNVVTGNLVPGFTARLNSNSITQITVTSFWGAEKRNNIPASPVPIHMVVTRVDGIIKLNYTQNGVTKELLLADQSTWDLNSYSPTYTTFGAAYIQGEVVRHFIGTLANIDIQVYE